MAGTWTSLTNPPPNTVCTTFLLTDGTVLAQGVSTNPYEAPMCQETNYPYERIFCFFSALGFLAQSADGLVF
jgi:hypothetical protein